MCRLGSGERDDRWLDDVSDELDGVRCDGSRPGPAVPISTTLLAGGSLSGERGWGCDEKDARGELSGDSCGDPSGLRLNAMPVDDERA